MILKKNSTDKIGFAYGGASLIATGTFGKVITYSIALLLILVGIAAIRNTITNKSPQY